MNTILTKRILHKCLTSEGFDIDNLDEIETNILNNKSHILHEYMGGYSIMENKDKTVISVDEDIKNLGFSQYLSFLINIPYFRNIYTLRRFIRDCGAIDFYNNKTSGELSYNVSVERGVEELVRIPQGMKITKALKFFTCGDSKLLTTIQTKYSQIINTSSIEGRLCVSCDPVDFLTMSINNSNWRSCMSLDGEYATGTLAYAMDSKTVMVYLKSDRPDEELSKLPGVKWNNKKWRCLLYFSEDYKTIIATKQYPFTSSALMEEALLYVKEAFNLTDDYKYETFESFKKTEYKFELASEGLIFNDLESHYNFPNGLFMLNGSNVEDVITIAPGQEIVCPKCKEHYLDYGSSFVCSECANRSICENCSEPIHQDEEMYYIDGMEICENCMTECCVVCDSCYEAFWNDSDYIVYTDDGDVYCCSCIEGMEDD